MYIGIEFLQDKVFYAPTYNGLISYNNGRRLLFQSLVTIII